MSTWSTKQIANLNIEP